MTRQADPLDRLRVASPCSVGWERMVGDDRVRFCNQCNLNVYNISEMTRKQAEALIATTEGRLCARLYRRTDGTILTRDCPVGLRALRRRVSRIAGATFTAMMGLCMNIFGQTPARECVQDSGSLPFKIERTRTESQSQDGHASILGTVFDPAGATIPRTKVTLINDESKAEQISISTEEGSFQFPLLEAGSYTLKVELSGFKTTKIERITIKPDETTIVTVNLDIPEAAGGGTIGIILLDVPPIDLSTTSVTTTITDDAARHLPLPE